jgi:NADP-dependent aldehyde dehydrogenase
MTGSQGIDQEADTSAEELDRVIGLAADAARLLVDTTPTERATWLEAVADALDAAGGDLVPLAAQESHLGTDRLKGELKRTTFQLRLFAGELRDGAFLQATIDHADPAWPMGARPDLRRMVRPIGPVAVYAASNFPFAFSVAGGDTASALAAGCSVVLKAHPSHPQLSRSTGAVVVDALRQAGAPEGTFAVVTGFETGNRLVQDPRIKAAAFTGSLKGGRALYDIAVSRPEPIPFYGELGSVNPAFVTRDAAEQRPDEVAAGFVGSVSLGVGQFCTKPGLLFLPAGHGLDEKLTEATGAVAAAPMLNDRIAEGFSSGLDRLRKVDGVRVLSDGGATLLVTTVAELLARQEEILEECFGPVSILVEYSSIDELKAAVEAFEGNLTATLHAEESADAELARELLPLLTARAGRVLWNGWPTGVAVSWAQHHGGPFPSTVGSIHTSVGVTAARRFQRPVAYQDTPDAVLPAVLRDANPAGVSRRINGTVTTGEVQR